MRTRTTGLNSIQPASFVGSISETKQRHRLSLPLIILMIATALPINMRSAHAGSEDNGYWTTVAAGTRLADKWTAGLAVQTRSVNDFGDLERTVIRPSVSYTANDLLRVTLGYDAHFINLVSDRVEQRIWQQWSARWLAKPVSLSSRVRLEERFVEDVDGTALRLRLKGQAVIPLMGSEFSAVLSNEYFVGLNDINRGPHSGFDQNRAYIGARYQMSKQHRLEVGYQMQHIDRGAREDITVHQLQVSVSLN